MILIAILIVLFMLLIHQKSKLMKEHRLLPYLDKYLIHKNELIVAIIVCLIVNFFFGFYCFYLIPRGIELLESKNIMLHEEIQSNKLFLDPYFNRFSSIEKEILTHGEHINDEILIQYSKAFISSDLLKLRLSSYLDLTEQIRNNNVMIEEDKMNKKICLLLFVFI